MSSTPRDLLQIDVIGKRRKEVENKADLQKGEHNRFMLIISVMSAKFKESVLCMAKLVSDVKEFPLRTFMIINFFSSLGF